MFNPDEFKGKFAEIKGEIKKKWGEITDDELTRTKGNGQALFGIIEQKFGAKKAEIESHFQQLKQDWMSKAQGEKNKLSESVNSKIDQTKDSIKKK